jgi:hypothetical protein
MSANYRTCSHTFDTGGTCNSAAVTNQKYCAYHLRYRARQLRMAQYRARAQRFDIKLPPLEDMRAVQSAISQVAEAIAADMIDLKRADRLLSALRLAARTLMKADKWPASPYHTEIESPPIDLAAEYGLPPDINPDAAPETVFAPPSESTGGPQLPDVGNCGDSSSTDWQLATADSSDILSPEQMVSPDTLEIAEIYNTVSPEAATVRMRQLERNRHRRELTANRKRFEQMAMRLNIRKLAELGAPPLSPSVGDRVGDFGKKPPASTTTGETIASKEAATA